MVCAPRTRRSQNLCLERARALGLQHAALPISQYVDNLVGRRVITVNQVYELMLHWLEKRDWRAAFELAIPKRKLAPEAEAAAHPEGQPETLS
jgi:tRNA (guanine9-N1)-methyltransferase